METIGIATGAALVLAIISMVWYDAIKIRRFRRSPGVGSPVIAYTFDDKEIWGTISSEEDTYVVVKTKTGKKYAVERESIYPDLRRKQ